MHRDTPLHLARDSPRGWLKYGNPPGDYSSAPRFGARTRRGTACQCPAIRGRTRCRLHGGRSTGPTTRDGLARLRALHTVHGRYAPEALALERRIRAYERNGRRSARALAREMRDPLLFARLVAADREGVPARVVDEMRAEVRAELAQAELQRLERLARR